MTHETRKQIQHNDQSWAAVGYATHVSPKKGQGKLQPGVCPAGIQGDPLDEAPLTPVAELQVYHL